MAKKTKRPRRSARGQRGRAGEKGERGERGERGEAGVRGARGLPGISHDELARLERTVEALRAESDIQMRRIADLQGQLDITLAQFRNIRKP